MLLAADVGNTNVTLGLFRGTRIVRRGRVETDPAKSAAWYGRRLADFARGAEVSGFVFGSVVPRLSPVFRGRARRLFGVRPVEITPRSPIGMGIRVDTPSEVGADRLLNALAARELGPGPKVVIDFGTATTFDCVSASGDYLGGAIIPGPGVSARALALKAAKLPEVEIGPVRRVIGKNTVDCIRAGLYFGYLGMVERVLAQTLKEMARGDRKKRVPSVVITGGLAGLYGRVLGRRVSIRPDLTLQGLRLAFEEVGRRGAGNRRIFVT